MAKTKAIVKDEKFAKEIIRDGQQPVLAYSNTKGSRLKLSKFSEEKSDEADNQFGNLSQSVTTTLKSDFPDH